MTARAHDAGKPGERPELVQVTLFDLDHTLIPIDSDYAWGVFTATIDWTYPEGFSRRNDEFFAQYQAGTLDIHDYVRFATKAIRQHGAQASNEAHERFMDSVVRPAIRAPALDLVRQHQQRGDQVAIITATNEFVTRPIAEALGVPELIAVELERDTAPGGSGWITGEIRGVPSARDGKVLRFSEWLQSRSLQRRDVHVTFYSDSSNDLPLLERVDQPVATNPDARLRATALARGWRILDLFPDTQ